MTDVPVEPGQILDGKYRVERVVGQGGMGVVLAVRHIALGHLVALKLLSGAGKPTPEQEARFLREGRIAAMLTSIHAGRVLNNGTLENGVPYIEMELFDGQDLAQLVSARGALSVSDAVAYVLQACHAIAEAHASGIVHRDLKPANIFLTKGVNKKPLIKVLDFGVARLATEDTKLTQTGQSLGSPLYMAPELMYNAKDVDGRADIWALGIVLYELLAEATPFEAATTMAVAARVLRDDPTPLTHYRPDVPPQLAATIMQCLQKDPARRWPSVADLVASLAPFAPAHLLPYVNEIAKIKGVEVEPSRPTAPLLDAAGAVRAPVQVATAQPRVPVASVQPTAPVRHPRVGLLVAALVVPVVAALGLVLRRPSEGAALPIEATQATSVSPPPALPAAASPSPLAPASSSSPPPTAKPAPPELPSANAAPVASPARHSPPKPPSPATRTKPAGPTPVDYGER